MDVRRWLADTYRVIRDAVEAYSRGHGNHFAAAMAFYTIFAVAPLLLISTAISGLIFGSETAHAELIAQLEVIAGTEASQFIDRLLENWRNQTSGIIATIVGGVTSLYLAFRAFDALRDTIDMLWGIRVRPDATWGELGLKYARSFAMIWIVGPTLLVSIVMSEVMTRVAPLIERWLALNVDLGTVAYLVASFFLLTAMFALIFKWLPDASIAWRDAWFGAVVTALLFSVGRTLIAIYLTTATTASMFGAAGSFVVVLFWIYYSAQILFFGAVLTEAYADFHDREVEPDETAVRLEVDPDSR